VGRDYPSLRGLLALPIPSTTPSLPGRVGSTSTSTSTTTPTTTADTRYVPVSPKSIGPLVGCP
jgi:hypothetical protein